MKHRTEREHECDAGCVVVPCRPLSSSSIRATHWILSAAFARAVRWRWLGRNPIEGTEPPAPVRSNPSPPSPAEAARLLNASWEDPEWGAFVWTAMTTGARRGELCSLKREDVDLATGTLFVRTGLKLVNGRLVRSETKTHQQRRIALDPETVEVLREYMARVDRRAELLDLTVGPNSYLFTLAPDGSTPWHRTRPPSGTTGWQST